MRPPELDVGLLGGVHLLEPCDRRTADAMHDDGDVLARAPREHAQIAAVNRDV